MIVIRNPSKWQGNTPTDCDYRVTKSQSIVKTLVNGELGHFASKGKQFDFIPTYSFISVSLSRDCLVNASSTNLFPRKKLLASIPAIRVKCPFHYFKITRQNTTINDLIARRIVLEYRVIYGRNKMKCAGCDRRYHFNCVSNIPKNITDDEFSGGCYLCDECGYQNNNRFA
jgi:hypothetical protein